MQSTRLWMCTKSEHCDTRRVKPSSNRRTSLQTGEPVRCSPEEFHQRTGNGDMILKWPPTTYLNQVHILYFIINWKHVFCLLIHNFTQFRHIMEMKNFHSYPHLCSVPSLGQVPHNAATWEGWSAREDKATSLHQDVKNISWVERGAKHNLKGEFTDHKLEVMKLKLPSSSENWNYHLI